MGEVVRQFMAVAPLSRGRDEEGVGDAELDDGKGFLPGIDPVDTVAEAFRRFRHTQCFHADTLSHASTKSRKGAGALRGPANSEKFDDEGTFVGGLPQGGDGGAGMLRVVQQHASVSTHYLHSPSERGNP